MRFFNKKMNEHDFRRFHKTLKHYIIFASINLALMTEKMTLNRITIETNKNKLMLFNNY